LLLLSVIRRPSNVRHPSTSSYVHCTYLYTYFATHANTNTNSLTISRPLLLLLLKLPFSSASLLIREPGLLERFLFFFIFYPAMFSALLSRPSHTYRGSFFARLSFLDITIASNTMSVKSIPQ
jgi:hypothetical protein